MDTDELFKLPAYIKIKALQENEPSFMKLRTEAVLRFHKFKKSKDLHEHLFSELQLYYSHTNDSKHDPNYSLILEKEDLKACQITYNGSQINNIKKKILPFIESVEEGMEAVHELRNAIGDELDPQNEQDRLEYGHIGLEDDPDYYARDFTGIVDENEPVTTPGLFKTTRLKPDDEIYKLIHRMDDAQRMVLDVAMTYIKNILISRKITHKFEAPHLIIQGGAGAGKSSVIHVIVQVMEKLLRQSGDNPDNPYVIPLSFTGTAAANIDGMTIHSAFNMPFGNEFLSLKDKNRDHKMNLCKNLKMIILDEFSMFKADLLYQIDLRLRELLDNDTVPFGGCAVFMFGDILQLKPVMGKYIFEKPMSETYHSSYTVNGSLWNTFEVVQLLTNHRQGEDFHYADVLNRIRSGKQTENDYKLLEGRVRPLNHPDIPSDALYVTCKNKHVNEINEQKLAIMDETLHEIPAVVMSCAQKNVKPRTSNDGSITNTPLQNILNLKVGAKVMLTYNIDVIDSLTNGAFGEIVGFRFDDSGAIKTIFVHFKNEKVGQKRREKYSSLQSKFNGRPVTPIEKIEFRFSMSKKHTSNPNLIAIQFPLKLAFACTAHKMQGATVCKPDQLILDLRHVMEPAQAYVMLSRVQALTQLYIIEEIPRKKIRPSPEAVTELQRMELISLNNPALQVGNYTIVTSLNIRSLSKHIRDLQNDFRMKLTKMICLQETWCSDAYDNNHLNIDGFHRHLTNRGNGKGIATYYKSDFNLIKEINEANYQMTKFSSNDCDIINVYRSQGADTSSFLKHLNALVQNSKECYIVGDFNINFIECKKHAISERLHLQGFEQLVLSPTHENGSLLDHAYIKCKCDLNHQALLHWPYYSDHAAICISQRTNVS